MQNFYHFFLEKSHFPALWLSVLFAWTVRAEARRPRAADFSGEFSVTSYKRRFTPARSPGGNSVARPTLTACGGCFEIKIFLVKHISFWLIAVASWMTDRYWSGHWKCDGPLLWLVSHLKRREGEKLHSISSHCTYFACVCVCVFLSLWHCAFVSIRACNIQYPMKPVSYNVTVVGWRLLPFFILRQGTRNMNAGIRYQAGDARPKGFWYLTISQ